MNLLIHGTDSCGVFAHPIVVNMAFFCYSFGSTCDTMFSDIYLNCEINSMTVAYFRLLLDYLWITKYCLTSQAVAQAFL